jgi:dienelactone hydrolase
MITNMAPRPTRRELGLAALSAGALARKASPSISDKSMIPSSELDPVAWTKDRYRSAPLQLTFRAQTRSEAQAWQRELRDKLIELLGRFPDRTDLRAATHDVREFTNYRREKLGFYSRPGVAVPGYVLTPTIGKRPFATVICIPGHGRGVDDIVGIDEHGNNRGGKPGYQHDFAIQVAEHGLAAVAIEPMAFGYRRDAVTREKGPSATACQPAAGSALLYGETMIGWRVWDVMRTIDWIETRPELDSRRIGCMGISGGGTCTQFSAVLDMRIKAAFVSGYLNTFRDSIMSVSHCIDNCQGS